MPFRSGLISLALMDWRTSTIVCRCASYAKGPIVSNTPPPNRTYHAAFPHLCSICSVIDRCLEATPQSAFGIAAPQQLPNLTGNSPHIGFGDLRLRRTKGRSVEVDAGVLGEGVNVDGAPVVAERGVRVLLDDGHIGGASPTARSAAAASVWWIEVAQ